MKKFIKRYKNTAWAKLAVLLGSLIVCLTILEIGLRATGWMVESGRERNFMAAFDEEGADYDYIFERYRPAKKSRLILAMGDSLTNGSNVSDRQSYPYHLYKNFADRGEKVAVYNMGYCQDTTFGTADKLKKYLAQKDAQVPDAVVVLIGASDLFYLPLLGAREDKGTYRDALTGGWLGDLRVVKVLSHILFNLPLFEFGEDDEANEKNLARLREIYAAHKKRAAKDESVRVAAESVAEMNSLFKVQLSREEFDLGKPADFLEFTADYAYEVYSREGRHDELFGLLLDMAENFPQTFWGQYVLIGDRYFPLSFNRQSKYTPRDALRVMDKTAAAHPDLAELKPFAHFRSVFRDRKTAERRIVRRRDQTLGELVKLCRDKGIKLILQTYPASYKSANTSLRRIAAKYRIPLVDNERSFAELIANSSREKYAHGDDHLTAIGYEIMARNVFDTLIREKLLASPK